MLRTFNSSFALHLFHIPTHCTIFKAQYPFLHYVSKYLKSRPNRKHSNFQTIKSSQCNTIPYFPYFWCFCVNISRFRMDPPLLICGSYYMRSAEGVVCVCVCPPDVRWDRTFPRCASIIHRDDDDVLFLLHFGVRHCRMKHNHFAFVLSVIFIVGHVCFCHIFCGQKYAQFLFFARLFRLSRLVVVYRVICWSL